MNKTREQVDAESKALTEYGRKKVFAKCIPCNGTGKLWGYIYGDPALGREYRGKCDACNGTGIDVRESRGAWK